jgi:hypothetical protein
LNKGKIIEKVVALCFVVLFSISITPKIYFHDVIANHKDNSVSCDHALKTKACIHQTGFNCQVDELVVSAPYLVLPVITSLLVYSDHPHFCIVEISSFKQYCFKQNESRGPPSA